MAIVFSNFSWAYFTLKSEDKRLFSLIVSAISAIITAVSVGYAAYEFVNEVMEETKKSETETILINPVGKIN